jgi:predicted ATPase/serine/threonine protein kinase
MPLAPGVRIGAYEVTSAIGAGGMGEVYRARDSRLKRDVALKVLPAEMAVDRDRLARFQREAEMLASLNHPRIAQVYGLEAASTGAGETLALVMEIVEGEDLAERIARGAVPLDDALAIAGQIAEALEAAHEKGIVHRDLKPANIKVRSDGSVKVLDFGLAKAFDVAQEAGHTNRAAAVHAATMASAGLTQAGMLVGTPAYMSPEQARGSAVDRRADVWAFGCVLFEMLTGRPAFAGDTMVDTLAAVVEREPDWGLLPAAVPDAILRVLKRCLQKRPADRMRDIADARLDIQQAWGPRGPRSTRGADDPRSQRHNLPAELTSFVGRTKERAELARVLASSRLLSLTGAGGAGKTRLALRLAADLAHDFRDGVWLVDLAPIATADLVAQTIASAIGVREAPQRTIRDVLLDTICHRELLLVLDNCEHLIEECAEITEALLRAAPALRIVATSREPLRVPGEAVWRVSSLSLPDDTSSPSTDVLFESEATRLFIERATGIDPAFAPAAENAATIARICRRLDGIPLAIELAAARVATLSVEQIDARLQDRFRLLTGGARTAVARQRTLEATMQWSYQLLTDQERVLLNRLSLFPAGWSLEAAEKVCGGNGIDDADMLDLLSSLVSKSLVTLEGQRDRRYRLLETVRYYARQRLVDLGDADRLRDRHFEFFFDEFRGVRTALQGHEQVRWLKRLHLEQDNVRAALEWAIASPALAEKALELAGALFWYWTKRGAFAEGRQWIERALAVNPHVRGSVRAIALIGLGHMLYFQQHPAEADAANAEALAAAREDGHTWAMAYALFGQALAAFDRGRHDEAAARASEAVNVGRSQGDDAGPLLVLGNLAMLSGDLDRARELYDESNDVNRRAGEIWGLGIGLLVAAGVRAIRGDFESAFDHTIEALTINLELEDPRGIAWTLETLAGLFAATGRPEVSARLWAAADRLAESIGLSLAPFIIWMRDRYLEQVKATLGSAPFDTAFAEGRAMSTAEAIAFVREQSLR